jgi:hypothetical protein
LARKKSETPSDIDKSAFYFIQYCGACHPGGWGEYDTQCPLLQRGNQKFSNEPWNPALLDGGLAPTVWGPELQRRGIRAVSEADCLICHLKGCAWKEGRRAPARAFRTGLRRCQAGT